MLKSKEMRICDAKNAKTSSSKSAHWKIVSQKSMLVNKFQIILTILNFPNIDFKFNSFQFEKLKVQILTKSRLHTGDLERQHQL